MSDNALARVTGKDGIEWTGRTNNVLAGCTPQSPGCRNCYAEGSCHRFHDHYENKPGLVQIRSPRQKHEGLTFVKTDAAGKSLGQGARWTGEIRCLPHKLLDPLSWARGGYIFANSVSDLFHSHLVECEFGRHFIAAYFGLMIVTPQHTYQLLTKQPDMAIKWYAWVATEAELAGVSIPEFCVRELYKELTRAALECEKTEPKWAEKLIAAALDVGLRWKFASFAEGSTEPIVAFDLLSPTGTVTRWVPTKRAIAKLRRHHAHEIDRSAWPQKNIHVGVSVEDRKRTNRIDLLRQIPAVLRFLSCEPLLEDIADLLDLDGIGWVLVGGESGQHARACALEWLERIIATCRAQDVAVFVKQLGAYVVSEQRAADTVEEAVGLLGEVARKMWPASRWLWRAGLKDAKGGDWDEWEGNLRIREMPKGLPSIWATQPQPAELDNEEMPF
jgi:protein gp37